MLQQLFISRLKLTVEENMFMISLNSNLMCIILGKQFCADIFEAQQTPQHYSFFYFPFLALEVFILEKKIYFYTP